MHESKSTPPCCPIHHPPIFTGLSCFVLPNCATWPRRPPDRPRRATAAPARLLRRSAQSVHHGHLSLNGRGPRTHETRSACRTGPSSAFSMQKVRPSTLIDPWVPASTSSLLRCFSPERVKSAASSDRPESDAVYSNDITAIYGHRINSGTVSSPSPVGRPQALNPSGCSGTKDQQPPSVL